MISRRGILWIVVGLAVAIGGALVSDRYASRAVRITLEDQLTDDTELLERWLRALGDDVDPQAFAADAAQALLSRVTLLAADGTVLGDSALNIEDVQKMENHINRPEVIAAQSRVSGSATRRSGTTNLTYFYSARRLALDGPIGFVRIATPLAGPLRIERPSLLVLLLAATIFAALVLGFAYVQIQRISASTRRLAGQVEKAEPVQAESYGNFPEVGQLAASIRDAQGQQVEQLEQAEQTRRVLSDAVEEMHEGLLLVDADRRVRLVNAAARNLFHVDFDPSGVPLAQIVRQPALLESVETALTTNVLPPMISLTTAGAARTFEVRVTPVSRAGVASGVQVLLLDVTTLRSLERIRQRFIANVSHELRTPLTAIKAAIETIADEAGPSEHPFVAMVQRNAETMEDLLEDLTDLSLIETGAVELEHRPFDLSRLVRETAEQLQPVAGAAPIRVKMDTALQVVGDRRRVRQVLTNLLSNAIKFNRNDAPIDIEGEASETNVVLRMRDRGIGIPTAELDKVFHRFHQVADDRSRNSPGNGLGLAIVKHLVLLHGGQVSAESELGVGSTFTVVFPKGVPSDLS